MCGALRVRGLHNGVAFAEKKRSHGNCNNARDITMRTHKRPLLQYVNLSPDLA